jgi:hypothetical protein
MIKALKVNVNGEEQIIAGADNAIYIACTTEYFPAYGKGNLRIYALVKPKADERVYAEWASFEKIDIENLNIEVVETEKPDKIKRDRPSHTDWSHEGKLQGVCSFCGKKQDQVKTLVAGINAYICNECIEVANEVIA